MSAWTAVATWNTRWIKPKVATVKMAKRDGRWYPVVGTIVLLAVLLANLWRRRND